MIYPSIDELSKKVDSKYTLVIIAARRARQIKNDLMEKEKKEHKSYKEVSMALEEIDAGKVRYFRKTKSVLR